MGITRPAAARSADAAALIRPWGIVKRNGDRYTLLCDMDRLTPPPMARLLFVLSELGIRPAAIGFDRSHSGRWHVEVKTWHALTSGEQVAAQMALGSDPWRERHNLARVICGARPEDWNLLFAVKLDDAPL